MKRLIGYAVFGLLAYAAVLAATFPAARAYHLARSRLPQGVQLYNLEGSVWDGRAAVAQVNGLRLSPVVWQYRPLGLLSGRVDVKVDIQRGAARADGVVGVYRDGSMHLADMRLALPAAQITQALRLPFVDLQGDLQARLDDARTDAGHLVALDGKVVWQGARVVKPADVNLGGLEADFTTGDNGVITGKLHDNGGPLQLNGLITLKSNGQYIVKADLAARDNSQPALNRMLDSMGRQGPGGKVSVSYNGTLPPLGAMR